jgi:protein gp37
MGDNSKIEWTEATWNVLTGCSLKSPGCRFCYAMKLAGGRLRNDPTRAGLTQDTKNGPVWTGEVRFNEHMLDLPLRWQRPRKIFVCAHSDLFHENVPDDWIDLIFAVMAESPQHTFQVLTKRPERALAYLSAGARRAFINEAIGSLVHEGKWRKGERWNGQWPLPNVWLGVSVENQEAADERIPLLLQAPAVVRWISAEPLLGPVNLRWAPYAHQAQGKSYRQYLEREGHVNEYEALRRLDWVVVGGESGTFSRPMHPEWATSLRDQCKAAGVAFLFKQWGDWAPRSSCYHTLDDGGSFADLDPEAKRWPVVRLTYRGNDGSDLANAGDDGSDAYMQRVGKAIAGRRLSGELHDGYPEVTNA